MEKKSKKMITKCIVVVVVVVTIWKKEHFFHRIQKVYHSVFNFSKKKNSLMFMSFTTWTKKNY